MASGIHTCNNRLIKGFLSKERKVSWNWADSLYIGTLIVKVDGITGDVRKATYTGHVNEDWKALGWGTAKDKDGRTFTGTFKDNVEHGVGKLEI